MEPVGDFYVHLLEGTQVSKDLTSSTKLLRLSNQHATVIHFYNGGWGGCRPCAAQMEEWGQKYAGKKVQFLCVCVESLDVARWFAQMFRFQYAKNGYIPGRDYFPVGFGQLGCSGFIVADGEGNFVSRKTKAYLDFGDDAFEHVEELIEKLLPKESQNNKRKSEQVSESTSADNVVEQKVDLSKLPSTGIADMDDEHEDCAVALQALIDKPNISNLQAVVDVLKEHFQHEYDLMKKHGFGGDANSTFSALYSHHKDHERILDLGRKEIQRLNELDKPCKTSKWPPAAAALDPKVAAAIAKAFTVHADTFDSLYIGKIPAR